MSRAATPPVSNPLLPFKQLSPSVYLYVPPDSTSAVLCSKQTISLTAATTTAAAMPTSFPLIPPPKLIILLTWLSAHPTHIAKYALGHRTLFPTSRILLIRSAPADMLYHSPRTQRQNLAPAVDVIRASCTPGTATPPDLLLHLFSNGGAHSTCALLAAFHATTGEHLPVHATVLDSAPGRATFAASVSALSSALPSSKPFRLPGLLLLHLVCIIYFFLFKPFGLSDPIELLREQLNDRVEVKETGRCYVYSEEDRLVGWRDVEDHAREAEERGFAVRTEMVGGSGHCAHARGEGSRRYWEIVRDTWEVR